MPSNGSIPAMNSTLGGKSYSRRPTTNSNGSSSWVKSRMDTSRAKKSRAGSSDGELIEEDEFHSARGSFESNYRGQVENALDVFYSFKGERPEFLKQ